MLLRRRPALCICVNVTSLSAPNPNTAPSDNNDTSLPATTSLATDKPPSVCNEPSVVDVASVASSVLRTPLNVPVEAASVPVETAPVVVIVDEPLLIFPNPEVILPEFRAPVATIAPPPEIFEDM